MRRAGHRSAAEDCLAIGTSTSANPRTALLTSHDGGATWTTVPGTPASPVAVAFRGGVPSLFCWSATDCLLQTGSLAVYRTTDGGLIWHRAALPHAHPATEIQLSQVACPTTTCIATASTFDDGHVGQGLGTPAILVSHDSGATWQLHDVPTPRTLPDR